MRDKTKGYSTKKFEQNTNAHIAYFKINFIEN